ncbi:hypothetical protein GGS23DRAFT_341782 [Durotheca rogersii]|uniref:uncharacterized protein n=1 Tax=Durotheca rogersii TaxID=419775 RepID=UPI00221E6701|nr:uncharacterized protein GGS23DRAFT_341782 [Durotheca rogersii]KAI5857431.1 hypothetical protein GGS23DRAFT_341782 [Durotheca rogersii]
MKVNGYSRLQLISSTNGYFDDVFVSRTTGDRRLLLAPYIYAWDYGVFQVNEVDLFWRRELKLETSKRVYAPQRFYTYVHSYLRRELLRSDLRMMPLFPFPFPYTRATTGHSAIHRHVQLASRQLTVRTQFHSQVPLFPINNNNPHPSSAEPPSPSWRCPFTIRQHHLCTAAAPPSIRRAADMHKQALSTSTPSPQGPLFVRVGASNRRSFVDASQPRRALPRQPIAVRARSPNKRRKSSNSVDSPRRSLLGSAAAFLSPERPIGGIRQLAPQSK